MVAPARRYLSSVHLSNSRSTTRPARRRVRRNLSVLSMRVCLFWRIAELEWSGTEWIGRTVGRAWVMNMPPFWRTWSDVQTPVYVTGSCTTWLHFSIASFRDWPQDELVLRGRQKNTAFVVADGYKKYATLKYEYTWNTLVFDLAS